MMFVEFNRVVNADEFLSEGAVPCTVATIVNVEGIVWADQHTHNETKQEYLLVQMITGGELVVLGTKDILVGY